MGVQVSYKSGHYKAKIVSVDDKKRIVDSADEDNLPLAVLTEKLTSSQPPLDAMGFPAHLSAAPSQPPVQPISTSSPHVAFTEPIPAGLFPAPSQPPAQPASTSLPPIPFTDLSSTQSMTSNMLNLLVQQNATLLRKVGELTHEVASLRSEVRELRVQSTEEASRSKGNEPVYVPMDGGQCLIGSQDVNLVVEKDMFDGVFRRSTGVKEFVVKLTGKLFSHEELAKSNFHGGDVFNGKARVKEEGLRKRHAFRAI